MSRLKVTSWNVEHLDRLLNLPPNLSDATRARREKRLEAIAEEIQAIDADILCLLEGPKGVEAIDRFCLDHLGGSYVAVKEKDEKYEIRGNQWIWFLVRPEITASASLLPPSSWKAMTEQPSWDVHYWGDFTESKHRHYRHPQTLVLDWQGKRVDLIGVHLKSKFVRSGKADWETGEGHHRRQDFVRGALKARVKMTTEAEDVRRYIDRRFQQTESPAIFVLGDLNDGPGKEYFEQRYLFFDLLSNLQGDVFFAQRFLNHALFDYPQHLRWSVEFSDFISPERDPHILLDHILFTQSLVDAASDAPFHIPAGAGLVEHEAHDFVNARYPAYAHTSDHRPVSVVAETRPSAATSP